MGGKGEGTGNGVPPCPPPLKRAQSMDMSAPQFTTFSIGHIDTDRMQ